MLIEAGIDVPPLDWPAIAEPIVEPSQLSLF
jgi:hypothetical protein